jgi:hypothetical protein
MFIFSIRYVLAFSIIVFLQGVLYISSPSCTCIYSGPDPQMNTVLFIIWYTEPTLGLGFLSFPSNCSWRCTCATQSSPVHRRGSFFFHGLLVAARLHNSICPSGGFFGLRSFLDQAVTSGHRCLSSPLPQTAVSVRPLPLL